MRWQAVVSCQQSSVTPDPYSVVRPCASGSDWQGDSISLRGPTTSFLPSPWADRISRTRSADVHRRSGCGCMVALPTDRASDCRFPSGPRLTRLGGRMTKDMKVRVLSSQAQPSGSVCGPSRRGERTPEEDWCWCRRRLAASSASAPCRTHAAVLGAPGNLRRGAVCRTVTRARRLDRELRVDLGCTSH